VFREVVTTHLVLVEEVRITTRRVTEGSMQQATVRREEAVVERYDAQSGSWKAE
jgi:stress response protein YsnF